MNPPAEPFVILPNSDVATEKDRALLQAVKDLDTREAQGGNKVLWVVLALLFVGLGGLNWGWQEVASVGVAVALHEFGHVLAMRYLGYKNVRMLFIPLFGGLATGQPQTSDASKNAIVALAGPIFGIITTVLAGVAAWYMGSPAWLVNYVWVSLILNAFNLLPIHPLDGGQVANEVLFSRVPTLELVFRFLAFLAMAFLAWKLGSLGLGFLAFLSLGAIQPAIRRSRFLKEYRQETASQQVELDEKTVARLRTAVQNIFPTVNADSLEKNMPTHVKNLWLDTNKSYPSAAKSTLLLVVYGTTLLVITPMLLLLTSHYLGGRF